MDKINTQYILRQYSESKKSYAEFTKGAGMWASEKYVFEKYLKVREFVKNNLPKFCEVIFSLDKAKNAGIAGLRRVFSTKYKGKRTSKIGRLFIARSLTDKILDLGCGTGRTTFPLFKMGFKNIIGIDLTPAMIEEAQKLNAHFSTNIFFETGDATNLNLQDNLFDVVIFSFNGLMTIPSQICRNKALTEIKRVLKPTGVFIFTTHDRDKEQQFLDFWKAEKIKWENNQQNPKLQEFGDLITFSKNEAGEIFIHIPSKKEIENWLDDFGFSVVETFYRIDKFKEKKEVLNKSGECRFWVARTNNDE